MKPVSYEEGCFSACQKRMSSSADAHLKPIILELPQAHSFPPSSLDRRCFEFILSLKKVVGCRGGSWYVKGYGTHHLINLDLEVDQNSTFVNSRFSQKMVRKSDRFGDTTISKSCIKKSILFQKYV